MSGNFAHFPGDVTITVPGDLGQGTGLLTVSSSTGGLVVEGLTELDQTTIVTDDGQFSVSGSNLITFDVTQAIQYQAAATSFFKTSVGNLQIDAEDGILDLDGNSVTINSDSTTVAITGATGVNLTSTANNITINAAATVDIDGTTSVLIDSGGTVSIDANAASNFTVTGGGNLSTISDTGRLILNGGSTASNAVTITATNVAGGVDIDAGTNGFSVLATDGPFNINGQNVSSTISLATNSNSQDLTISLTGTTDSSVVISSSGTGGDAIRINSSSATGGLDIDSGTGGIIADTTGSVSLDAAAASNFTTSSGDLTLSSTANSVVITAGEAIADAITITSTDTAGGIDINSGTGGLTVDTTGGFSIDSQSTSNITLTGTNVLTINNTAGQLIVQSGEATVDAVTIYASDSAGGIDIDSGTGGITIDSQGSISLDATGVSSNFTLATSGNAQDLTFSLTGATDSSIILSSTGTSTTDAIKLSATAGGIDIDSTQTISIDTTNTTTGITIATATLGVPVTIGTGTSVTTIAGDLIVSGNVVQFDVTTNITTDNIIQVNSGDGSLGIDGGLVVRRYQPPNDTDDGDVILDTPFQTGAFQAGSSTPSTLVLDSTASSLDNFYNDHIIRITSGSGSGQVRRIKDYVGSTRTATLYITTDNTEFFFDGLDLTTAPAATDTYEIFNTLYTASYFDESEDTWNFVYTTIDPQTTVVISKYIELHTGKIDIHGQTAADSELLVNYINEHDTDQGVTIEGVLIKDGIINGVLPPSSEVVTLVDNTSTPVDIVGTTTAGCYRLMAIQVQAATGSGSYLYATGGASGTFDACSIGVTNNPTRTSTARGSANQRIDMTWNTGQKIRLFHQNTFSGGSGANVFYRVYIQKVI
jgi:hypothetical protein